MSEQELEYIDNFLDLYTKDDKFASDVAFTKLKLNVNHELVVQVLESLGLNQEYLN